LQTELSRKGKLAARELARRKAVKDKPVDLLEGSFPEQIAFIRDLKRRKILLCSRRAGKSYGVGLLICLCGLLNPGCTMTYITLTYSMGQRIMSKDIVERINSKFKLGLRITTSAGMQVHFPNGSICYVIGTDSDEKQRDKILGQRQHLVILDEAQSFTINTQDLIERVIAPQCHEVHGTIVMAGTPCDEAFGYYYELTKEYKTTKGWSYHSWLQTSNPYVAEAIAEEIAEILSDQPDFKETNTYKQQYMGLWSTDAKALIYRLNDRCYLNELPAGQYHYVLGVDLGWIDCSAFVLGAFNQNQDKDHNVYILHAQKSSSLDLTNVSQIIKGYQRHYPVHKIIIDGAARQSCEELRQRLGIPLSFAEKLGKNDHINLFNMSLDMGRIRILPEAQPLIDEMEKLTWIYNERFRKRIENPSAPNHCCDAALYMFMSIHNWESEETPMLPKSEVTVDMILAKEKKLIAQQMDRDPDLQYQSDDPIDQLAREFGFE
jgi:hypothetical protein